MNRIEACNFMELPQNASDDQIKQSYKRLAKKYHPDRPSGSKESFQKLQKAYETLMNKSDDPFAGAFAGHPHANIFEQMFRAHQGGVPFVRTQHANIFTQRTQSFQLRDILQGNVQYKGVTIPKWIKHGDMLKISQNERLQVHIQWPPGVKPHPSGRNNILIRKRISLDKALLGREIRVMHPDGRPLRVKEHSYTFQVRKEYRIRGEGLPDRAGDYGDLLLNFEIVMPEQLTEEQIHGLKALFPNNPLPRVHHEKEVEIQET